MAQLQRLAITAAQICANKIDLTKEQQHYLNRVLRLQAGDRFIAMDGCGHWWSAILEAQETGLFASIKEEIAVNKELPVAVTLIAALPKGNGFDEAVRQATELGVASIVPVTSDRTLLKPSTQKVDRWRRIAAEAAEQSERQIVPTVYEPLSFDLAVKDCCQKHRFICVARGDNQHLWDCLIGLEPPQPPLLRGEQDVLKVPLLKGDLGGSDLGASERYVEWRAGKTADIDKCLTLAEIFGLRFKQCRLVVLSACETALIDTQNRSDYIGLPTGFLYAGAMGTLASLWAVNDLSTALMMVKFYEVLQPGVSIGQALHDTQRWFKSATTSDLLEWVKGSKSFNASQKKQVLKELDGYDEDEKPYGDVYHCGAFCAMGL
jgi:16S rRNA (uracil1498-N3)-methyltransferase